MLIFAWVIQVHCFICCESNLPDRKVIIVHRRLRLCRPKTTNSNRVASLEKVHHGWNGFTLFFRSIDICTSNTVVVNGKCKLIPFCLINPFAKTQNFPSFFSRNGTYKMVAIFIWDELQTRSVAMFRSNDISPFTNLAFLKFHPNAIRNSRLTTGELAIK